ncbi:MAG TPA: NnrS family protein [Burkholderiaceae bacterium]|nr:NnrS family protein [Burkholderiaceae bacterium]
MALLSSSSGLFSAPLWRSAFRPFYLLGTAYGALFMLAWLGAYIDLRPSMLSDMPLKFWHGHEIVFGFAAAIITGIVLTALPSWAGTEEIKGGRLALLAALWLAGRLAVWLAPWLPAALVAACDCALFPTVAAMVAPQLLRAANKLYLLLLPVLAGLCAANIAFHLGSRAFGLHLAIYSIMLLYVLKGGVLTPIFTSNALREKKYGIAISPSFTLDALAAASIALLAAIDLAALPASWVGLAAAAACMTHALRLVRWRGWLVMDVPLVLAMHLGYAWLVIALGLKAAAQFTAVVPEAAWLHAFTVGALGMMMMGLMTRVALRHTGRPLALSPVIVASFWLMFIAAMLRVSATLFDLGRMPVAASAVLWVAPFTAYLILFGPMLVRPSMARKGS